jgi:hypothetical protein
MSDTATSATPAIGYSITANIDGNRQIVFQHFVAADEDDTSVNANLDRIMGLVDRQRARYEIPGLQEELDTLTNTMAQYEEDRARVDLEYDKAMATLDVQIEEMGGKRKEFFDQGYEQHKSSGRQGSYKPQGMVKTNIARVENAIEQAKDAKTKNLNERAQAIENLEISITRHKARIALVKERIAKLKESTG